MSAACICILIFNWHNAVLTEKLTRAKEEGLSVKQMLDQTLMEMVNIWPTSQHCLIGSECSWFPCWEPQRLVSSGLAHNEEDKRSTKSSTNNIGMLHLSICFHYTKGHCTTWVGLHLYVGRICTFVGKITAHDHCEQSHKLSQGCIKGTFIMCLFCEVAYVSVSSMLQTFIQCM